MHKHRHNNVIYIFLVKQLSPRRISNNSNTFTTIESLCGVFICSFIRFLSLSIFLSFFHYLYHSCDIFLPFSNLVVVYGVYGNSSFVRSHSAKHINQTKCITYVNWEMRSFPSQIMPYQFHGTEIAWLKCSSKVY